MEITGKIEDKLQQLSQNSSNSLLSAESSPEDRKLALEIPSTLALIKGDIQKFKAGGLEALVFARVGDPMAGPQGETKASVELQMQNKDKKSEGEAQQQNGMQIANASATAPVLVETNKKSQPLKYIVFKRMEDFKKEDDRTNVRLMVFFMFDCELLDPNNLPGRYGKIISGKWKSTQIEEVIGESGYPFPGIEEASFGHARTMEDQDKIFFSDDSIASKWSIGLMPKEIAQKFYEALSNDILTEQETNFLFKLGNYNPCDLQVKGLIQEALTKNQYEEAIKIAQEFYNDLAIKRKKTQQDNSLISSDADYLDSKVCLFLAEFFESQVSILNLNLQKPGIAKDEILKIKMEIKVFLKLAMRACDLLKPTSFWRAEAFEKTMHLTIQYLSYVEKSELNSPDAKSMMSQAMYGSLEVCRRTGKSDDFKQFLSIIDYCMGIKFDDGDNLVKLSSRQSYLVNQEWHRTGIAWILNNLCDMLFEYYGITVKENSERVNKGSEHKDKLESKTLKELQLLDTENQRLNFGNILLPSCQFKRLPVKPLDAIKLPNNLKCVIGELSDSLSNKPADHSQPFVAFSRTESGEGLESKLQSEARITHFVLVGNDDYSKFSELKLCIFFNAKIVDKLENDNVKFKSINSSSNIFKHENDRGAFSFSSGIHKVQFQTEYFAHWLEFALMLKDEMYFIIETLVKEKYITQDEARFLCEVFEYFSCKHALPITEFNKEQDEILNSVKQALDSNHRELALALVKEFHTKEQLHKPYEYHTSQDFDFDFARYNNKQGKYEVAFCLGEALLDTHPLDAVKAFEIYHPDSRLFPQAQEEIAKIGMRFSLATNNPLLHRDLRKKSINVLATMSVEMWREEDRETLLAEITTDQMQLFAEHANKYANDLKQLIYLLKMQSGLMGSEIFKEFDNIKIDLTYDDLKFYLRLIEILVGQFVDYRTRFGKIVKQPPAQPVTFDYNAMVGSKRQPTPLASLVNLESVKGLDEDDEEPENTTAVVVRKASGSKP